MDKSKIPTARQLMEKVPTTFPPDMSLVEAIETLATMHVSAAPVVDDDACFLGMLTDRDCLRIVSVSAFHRPRGGKVADFLSPVKQAVELEMDLFRIAEIFLTTHFTVLPVLERGRLVGCINREGMLNGITFLTKVWKRRCQGRSGSQRGDGATELDRRHAAGVRQALQGTIGPTCRTP